MGKEQFQMPFSENVLVVFENTGLKFYVGLAPDCSFPRRNRVKKKKTQ